MQAQSVRAHCCSQEIQRLQRRQAEADGEKMYHYVKKTLRHYKSCACRCACVPLHIVASEVCSIMQPCPPSLTLPQCTQRTSLDDSGQQQRRNLIFCDATMVMSCADQQDGCPRSASARGHTARQSCQTPGFISSRTASTPGL